MQTSDSMRADQTTSSVPTGSDVQTVTESISKLAIKSDVSATLRGTSVRLSVPLDSTPKPTGVRKTVRRDSLERREALLRGKEGTRQRRRWENDRLLNNPWAEPPLPSDWEVRPTYPRRTVPYYLAPLWDAAEFQRAIESRLKGRRNTVSKKRRNGGSGAYAAGMNPFEDAAANIPKEIRARLKHARSAKGLLQDLEEEVREFVKKWNEREARMHDDGLQDVPVMSDSEEDEEIVFVGRNGIMHDSPGRKEREEGENLLKEKLVFEGLETDKGAAFGRWLAHCIGSYYGLKTWSVTTGHEGEEKMRQAFVGVDARARGWMGQNLDAGREMELPRPLWGLV